MEIFTFAFAIMALLAVGPLYVVLLVAFNWLQATRQRIDFELERLDTKIDITHRQLEEMATKTPLESRVQELESRVTGLGMRLK